MASVTSYVAMSMLSSLAVLMFSLIWLYIKPACR